MGRLLGILGRASATLGGESVYKLYNALVLPHLQYCLMIWGDFEEGRNKLLGESLLRYQKKFLGLISERRGRYHSDPIFSRLGILKVHDLYKQQLRIHAWKFVKDRLPNNQVAMLSRVSDRHSHNTRSSKSGLYVSTQDHRSIGYRIPKEWQALPEVLRQTNSLGGLKKKSKEMFLENYRKFSCKEQNCFICTGDIVNALQRGRE